MDRRGVQHRAFEPQSSVEGHWPKPEQQKERPLRAAFGGQTSGGTMTLPNSFGEDVDRFNPN